MKNLMLSSNWTLAFRLFLPTLWLSFFGAFLVATIFTNKNAVGEISINGLRVGLFLFVFVFGFIFWQTLFKLKRIDADSEYLYVTNYLKNVRYPHADIAKIELSKGTFLNFGVLVLKGKGIWGDRLRFIASRKRIELFLENNPHLDWLEVV